LKTQAYRLILRADDKKNTIAEQAENTIKHFDQDGTFDMAPKPMTPLDMDTAYSAQNCLCPSEIFSRKGR